MKELHFYLFFNDDIQEIVRVSSDNISRALLLGSSISHVADAGSPNISNEKSRNSSIKYEDSLNFSCGDCVSTDDAKEINKKSVEHITSVKVYKSTSIIIMDLYHLSYFHYLLEQSPSYRQLVINHFARFIDWTQNVPNVKVKIKLLISIPSYHVLDHLWCTRLERLCYERQELETAMAWLSTLGGAFSALGDKQEQCAVIAGRISVQQLRNAMRLGDPFTVARCKLYFSLSLIQQRRFRPAKHIIKEQYRLAIANKEKDFKLVRMCLGIWSKLKYEKKYKKKSKVS